MSYTTQEQIDQDTSEATLIAVIDLSTGIIEKQAKVIKENWSELQALKRILIDEYPDTWTEIKNKIQ